jgi:hypothetical protein
VELPLVAKEAREIKGDKDRTKVDRSESARLNVPPGGLPCGDNSLNAAPPAEFP